MKLAPIVFAASLVLLANGFADVTKLAAVDRSKIEGAVNPELLRFTKDIPETVRDACAAVISDHVFRLAEPGQEFQVTDAILKPNLPRRRLIWAARIPGYYVVHYEMGGRGHSYHVLLVEYDEIQKSARVVWSAAGTPGIPLKDYAQFVRALKSGKLDDQRDYYH